VTGFDWEIEFRLAHDVQMAISKKSWQSDGRRLQVTANSLCEQCSGAKATFALVIAAGTASEVTSSD